MARRGFFAELQHQSRVAQREAERQQRAAARDHAAAVRRAEQARKAEERARQQAARARGADRKQREKEAQAAHAAAMEVEVERRNTHLAEIYDEIDNLLAATLTVDDYVDLDMLKQKVEHPPFDRADLESPLPTPAAIIDPPEPVFMEPEPPKAFFGKKKKHASAIASARAAHAQAQAAWKRKLHDNAIRRQAAAEEHVKAESERLTRLEVERARFAAGCSRRETEVAEHNAKIEALKTNLGYGTVDAIQEYVSIVISNSVYPERFQVDHDFEYEPSTAELRMRVLVPPPSELPTTRAYKYTKSTDEITETSLSQKACKDRYAGAVRQVSLRTLHEVFEADRRGLIKTISLEVGTQTTSPATGNRVYLPFVAVAAARETFLQFDLSSVVPSATLDHLGAAVSKNPYELVAIDAGGVRQS